MPIVKDGTYKLSLSVDRHCDLGLLTVVENSGQGGSGPFRVEVHVNVAGSNELRGVANVLVPSDVSGHWGIPQHFSFDVEGSGDRDRFNLIGRGPDQVIVEFDAWWLNDSTPLP